MKHPEHKKQEAISLVRQGLSRKYVCELLEISQGTLYRWLHPAKYQKQKALYKKARKVHWLPGTILYLSDYDQRALEILTRDRFSVIVPMPRINDWVYLQNSTLISHCDYYVKLDTWNSNELDRANTVGIPVVTLAECELMKPAERPNQI